MGLQVTRRPCARCALKRPETSYVSSRGRICAVCRTKTRKATGRAGKMLQRYGLSAEDHAELVVLQGAVCAICKKPRRYLLHVDHDHATGAVRGLLCKQDNQLLRLAGDDVARLQAAVEYLRCPPTRYLAAVKQGGIG